MKLINYKWPKILRDANMLLFLLSIKVKSFFFHGLLTQRIREHLSPPGLTDLGSKTYIFAHQRINMMHIELGSRCAVQNTTEVNVYMATKILRG